MNFSRDEVVGRPVSRTFYSERGLRKLELEPEHPVAGLGGFRNIEWQLVARHGEVMDVIMSAIPELGSDGEVHRMLVASKDVTERKRGGDEFCATRWSRTPACARSSSASVTTCAKKLTSP